mmetsp:Transcript_20550/g.33364  ORF Transcript_20550/g.33364 Transcript_20550/m.33364 type:complete len:669 (-) Transcript_20550:354-2360(-)
MECKCNASRSSEMNNSEKELVGSLRSNRRNVDCIAGPSVPLLEAEKDQKFFSGFLESRPWLERLCVCCIGAAATAPVYYILYCLGWLKACQGNGVVLMLLVTFYPVGLLTLIGQLYLDHKFDRAYGRRGAMLCRFMLTICLNVTFLPTILPNARSTVSLVLIFCVLGFANAACVGTAYEVCLQMPTSTKSIQYLSIGLQAGGVLTGLFGLITGHTSLSVLGKGNLAKYAPASSALVAGGERSSIEASAVMAGATLSSSSALPVASNSLLLPELTSRYPTYFAWNFTLVTTCFCVLGFIGILALDLGSHYYRRHVAPSSSHRGSTTTTRSSLVGIAIKAATATAALGGIREQEEGATSGYPPSSPPPSPMEAIRVITCSPLRVAAWTLVVTTSITALTTGFYPFTPSSAISGFPDRNSGLIVLLVYVNQMSDLVGRIIPAFVPCPTGNTLVFMSNARLIILVPLFFGYISQRYIVSDCIAIALVVSLQVSHGALQTWAFVHSAHARSSINFSSSNETTRVWSSSSLSSSSTSASPAPVCYSESPSKCMTTSNNDQAELPPESTKKKVITSDVEQRSFHKQRQHLLYLQENDSPYHQHPYNELHDGGSAPPLHRQFSGQQAPLTFNEGAQRSSGLISKLLMIVLQFAVVLGGLSGQALAFIFFHQSRWKN